MMDRAPSSITLLYLTHALVIGDLFCSTLPMRRRGAFMVPYYGRRRRPPGGPAAKNHDSGKWREERFGEEHNRPSCITVGGNGGKTSLACFPNNKQSNGHKELRGRSTIDTMKMNLHSTTQAAFNDDDDHGHSRRGEGGTRGVNHL